jgi:hypothetical protein
MFGDEGRWRQTACKPGSVPPRAILRRGWPFLWDARCRAPRATDPSGGAKARSAAPEISGCQPLLLGLAPGGVFPAAAVAGSAVRSYRTVSPLPRAGGTPERVGGVLSVALSLGSPPPGVTRHRASVEPGLSSLRRWRRAAIRPSGTIGFGYDRADCQRPRLRPARLFQADRAL